MRLRAAIAAAIIAAVSLTAVGPAFAEQSKPAGKPASGASKGGRVENQDPPGARAAGSDKSRPSPAPKSGLKGPGSGYWELGEDGIRW